MFSLLVNTGQAAVALLLIASMIAANRSAKLIFSDSENRLHRKTRKLVFWSWSIVLLALVSTTSDIVIAATLHPAFWLDRLLLRTPLVLFTALSVALVALPRIYRLMQRTGTKSAQALDVARRRQATETGLVMPFKLTALGSAGAFYFFLNSPLPFVWFETLMPITILVFLGGLLWMHQSSRNQAATTSADSTIYRPWKRRLRLSASAIAAIIVASLPLLIAAEASRLPDSMSMMSGTADFGYKATSAGNSPSLISQLLHAGHHSQSAESLGKPHTSVTALSGPKEGKADRVFELTAKQADVTLESGKVVNAWTYNGQIPGPELRMKQGELIEVKLTNQDIEDGVTIHWHGLDVPNAEDGVAGATQDAVMPGQSHTYRFVAEQTGTYWYHSHQHSKEAVEKGLFGMLIVDPPPSPGERPVEDITVATHVWDGVGLAIGTNDSLQRRTVEPGTPVKLRLLNTDNWSRKTHHITGTSFKVTAIDGVDLNEPGELTGTSLYLTTGARYDVEFVMPDRPVYVSVDKSKKLGILLAPDDSDYEVPDIDASGGVFDMTRYGKPADTPFGPDSKFDREFTMLLDNGLAFYNGVPGLYDTINGNVFPYTPMFVVKEGELVKTTIINRSAVDHPMHLHGHHMLVLSRNGKEIGGSPWWSDTLDVLPGEVYEVAFLANNPGLWMDHCHNLVHAAAGMTMHLMYDGVTSPFEIGADADNHPE
ncbi:MAG: multicopper oxidase [Paenibacillus sp.]|nr:multicopper oxidase [Paenibacillus sp.]